MNHQHGYSEEERKALRGWGEWLEETQWTVFCLFTTHYGLSIKAARCKMQKFTEDLILQFGKDIRLFWVAEPFNGVKDYHIHSLIKTIGSIESQKKIITKIWHKVSHPAGYKKHNLAMVEEYIPAKGAHFYVIKHLSKPDIDYEIF